MERIDLKVSSEINTTDPSYRVGVNTEVDDSIPPAIKKITDKGKVLTRSMDIETNQSNRSNIEYDNDYHGLTAVRQLSPIEENDEEQENSTEININIRSIKAERNIRRYSELSVNMPSKQEEQERREDDKAKTSTSIWYSFMKWIVTAVMLILNLACLVLNKLSLIVVAGEMKDGTPRIYLNASAFLDGNSTTMRESSDNFSADVSFAMVVLLMLIPHVVAVLRVLIDSSTGVWPTGKAFMWVSDFLK